MAYMAYLQNETNNEVDGGDSKENSSELNGGRQTQLENKNLLISFWRCITCEIALLTANCREFCAVVQHFSTQNVNLFIILQWKFLFIKYLHKIIEPFHWIQTHPRSCSQAQKYVHHKCICRGEKKNHSPQSVCWHALQRKTWEHFGEAELCYLQLEKMGFL